MYFLPYSFFLFSIYFSFYSVSLFAQTEANNLPRSPLTEVTLKNGLHVCLKQSNLESDHFDFQLFALGGYASLPIADQPSAWLATVIAWESGLNHLTSDELECGLDDHSLEIKMNVGLFDRQIEVNGPTTELAHSLSLIRLLFTHPQFNEKGLKKALILARDQIYKKSQTSELTESHIALKVNLRNWSVITPFNYLDLHHIELEKAQQLFKKFFSNPAEFMLVLVGDIDPKHVIPLLEKSLGSLPAYPRKQWLQPPPPSFPPGITTKDFQDITRYKRSHMRLTFPLSPSTLDPLTLDVLCTLLKQRFLAEATPPETWKKDLNIGYHFPLFPCLNPLWLVIKYSSSKAEMESLHHSIIQMLKAIQQTGITEVAIKQALQEIKKQRENISENGDDLSLLANYYRAGWNVKQLEIESYQDQQEKEMLKKVRECYPHLDQYSLISLHP